VATFLAGPLSLALMLLLLRLFAPNALAVIERPLASAAASLYRVSIGAFVGDETLRREVQELSLQVAALAPDAAETASLREENENLKRLIGFFERQSFSHVTARVISRSSGPLASTIVIDRGEEDGIMVGLPVVISDGYLLGKIIETSRRSSVVRPLTDSQSAAAVSILNASRTIGIVEGTDGALLRLRFIPQDEEVGVNDLIVTSGLEEHIPPGLLVGLVNTVTQDRAAPFQEAVIEPFMDERTTGVVGVIVPIAL
jgi:rod shape-determining protein MreC